MQLFHKKELPILFQRNKTIVITIKNDPEANGNRTFEIELTSPLTAVISTPLLGDIKVTHVTIMDVGKKIYYPYK